MDFEVSSLDDVRTIVEVWKAVVEATSPHERVEIGRASMQLPYDVVGVSVIRKQPEGLDVILEFVGPWNVMTKFFNALREKGLQFTRELDRERRAFRCRVKPADTQP